MTDCELVEDTIRRLELQDRVVWFFKQSYWYHEKPYPRDFIRIEVHRYLEFREVPDEVVALAKRMREMCPGTFPGG